MLFAYELAERLAGSGVTVNTLHPGVVGTSFLRDTNGFMRWLARTFFMTPAKGARASAWAAAARVAGVTGKYSTDTPRRRRRRRPTTPRCASACGT